jgi:hypothetical protein
MKKRKVERRGSSVESRKQKPVGLPSVLSLSRIALDKVPPGWYTRAELQKEWRLSSSRSRELIQSAVDRGVAVMKIFRISTRTRGSYPMQHYKFKA